jgi:hypothetical protein
MDALSPEERAALKEAQSVKRAKNKGKKVERYMRRGGC